MMNLADPPTHTEPRVRRVVSATTLLSSVLALAVLPVALASIHGDLAAGLGAPLGPGAAPDAALQRLSNLLDMFGYYLLLVPLALYLHAQLGTRRPQLARFSTVCGLAYLLIGACGAAVFAAVLPALLAEHAQAPAPRREAIEVVYGAVWSAVYGGLWNTLEAIPAGLWWLGTGLLLRAERPRLGAFTIVLGALALVDSFGMLTGIQALGPQGIGVVWVLLAPWWAAWTGIALARQHAPGMTRSMSPGLARSTAARAHS